MDAVDASKTHVFHSPCKIIIGWNASGLAGAEIQPLGGGKALIVTDPGLIDARLLAPVEAALQSAGIAYANYDAVTPEPPSGVIDRGVEVFRAEGCRLVLGGGGGSSLDTAKGISMKQARLFVPDPRDLDEEDVRMTYKEAYGEERT